MQRLAGRTAFTVGDREYRWEDVVLAAHLWGEHDRLKRRAREGIACRKRLNDLGRELPAAAFDEFADPWRYERDLLSADDLESWLDERDLTMDDWQNYIERSAMRSLPPAELQKIVKAHSVSAKEIDAALYCEAVCSATLHELSGRLAGAAAIYDRVAEERKSSRSTLCTQAELRAAANRLPAAVKKSGILGIPAAATRKRAELVACLILTLDKFVDRAGAPAALAREIESHALDWTNLRCQTVTFSAEETAREAALLVREDGMALSEAAALAKSAIDMTTYTLEDVEPPLRDRLVAALPGELIGPVPANGDFVLVSVLERAEPSTKDRSIRTRAEERIVRRTIQREIDKRVRWHEHI